MLPGAPTSRTRADRGPQVLDQASSRGAEPVGGDNNRQCDPSEAYAAGVRNALGDLDAVTAPVQQLREAGSLPRVPTDDHDPAAHPSHPRTRQHVATVPQRGTSLPAGYPRVIRRWHRARMIAWSLSSVHDQIGSRTMSAADIAANNRAFETAVETGNVEAIAALARA